MNPHLPAPRSTPDGLQEPRRDMRRGPNVYRKQPPIVGDVCQGVATKNANAQCAYQSKLCSGDRCWCPRCRFPYCSYHYPKHVRTIVAPQDIWSEFARRLARWKEAVNANPKAQPKVQPQFPIEEARIDE
ncbi:MAG: hypothetical protein LC620_00385 [Halobacteriales archaeon]|nr:hypothetical protein [Halobacteriales archaeon]